MKCVRIHIAANGETLPVQGARTLMHTVNILITEKRSGHVLDEYCFTRCARQWGQIQSKVKCFLKSKIKKKTKIFIVTINR